MHYHEPVLLQEVIHHFKPSKNKKYIDCTLGDGGHSRHLLKSESTVLGLDYNNTSLKRAKKRLIDFGNKFFVHKLNFKDIDKISKLFPEFSEVDGILFDLGYSSSQLVSEDGLAYNGVSELDMRLDHSLGITAKDLLHAYGLKELEYIFKNYGEVKSYRKLSKEILEYRKNHNFNSTQDLNLFIELHDFVYEKSKIYQALRIAVNDEINNIDTALQKSIELLKPDGILIIISFHSIEDKIAKSLKKHPQLEEISGLIHPTDEEIARNNLSRSARMRVYAKRS
jgi:16S rRNA (cytosine1402-N4)-methyltransferase